MAKDNEKYNQPKDPRIRLYAITVYYIYQECFKKAGIIENSKFDKDRWAGRLVNKLVSEFPGNTDIITGSYEQYIRDRFNMACTYINQQTPFKWIGYSHVNFDPILTYAGVKSFDEINCAFKIPPQIPKFIVEPVEGLKLMPDVISKFVRKTEIQITETVELRIAETITSPIIPGGAAVTEPAKVPFVYTSKPYSSFNFFNRIAEDEGEIYFYDNGDCELRGTARRLIKKADLLTVDEFRMPGDKENLWVKLKYRDGDKLREAYLAQPQPGESSLKLIFPEDILNKFNAEVSK